MELDTFIEQYPDAFSKEYCDKVIDRFETMAKHNQVGFGSSLNQNADTRTVFDWAPHNNMYYHDPELVQTFYDTVNKYYKEQYCQKFDVLKDKVAKHTPKGMSVQRTDPKQGYHVWHVEAESIQSASRVAVYMLYLNTVKEGGETEWIYQGVKSKPVAGKLVFFPATWQHPHRGNPIYEGNKYIITGWFTWDS